MNLELLIAVALFSFVTSVTPGPNNTFLLTSGANFGVRKSLPYVNGIMLGLSAMMIAIGAGLGLVFTAFPVIYQILKFVGFAYIAYIAWQIIRSTSKNDSAEAIYMGMWKSFVFQFANPKAWIVIASFMASFVPLHQGLLVSLFTCVIFLVFTYPGAVIWAIFGQGLKTWLANPQRRRVFNIVAAVVLVATMVPVLFI